MTNSPLPDAVNVLVVEDDEVDLEVVRRAFKKQNFGNTLYHARSGIDALELLRGRDPAQKIIQPCLLLVDINMPRMNGLELLREIRNDQALKKSVVFMLTTSKRDSDIETAYEMNAAGYFLKENVDRLASMLGFYWEINKFSGK